MKIADFCAEVHNWFDFKRAFGEFSIENGRLVVDDMLIGQYFRIIGSVFNDGVYKYPATELTDEIFNGAIWYMAIPPDAIALINDMTAWEDKNFDIINSPFSSESFGGYSYSRASGGGNGSGGGSLNAFSQFSDRLKRYRKVRNV